MVLTTVPPAVAVDCHVNYLQVIFGECLDFSVQYCSILSFNFIFASFIVIVNMYFLKLLNEVAHA